MGCPDEHAEERAADMTGSGRPRPAARLRDAVFGPSYADVTTQVVIVLVAWGSVSYTHLTLPTN